jgi:hypothetical protein
MNKQVDKDFMKKIAKIQRELKAPKGQYNSFGKYHYRSCEDILEGVKPLLGDLVLIISDDMVNLGDRFYVKATASITDGENTISNSAFARESFDKKGMDDSQITGSTSSYARKYALNGLFGIDDTKDADTQDNRKEEVKKPQLTVPKTMSDAELFNDKPKQPTIPENLFKCVGKGNINDTFALKDELKGLGFKFNADIKQWCKQIELQEFEVLTAQEYKLIKVGKK